MVNLKEAYQILEIPETSTAEEARQRYREFAKKYHPDNLKTGDVEKFKKITQAYEAISNPAPAPQQIPFNPFGGSSPFSRKVNRQQDLSNVDIYTNITFAESVLGCKKELKYNRKGKCQACNGQGMQRLHNGCTECNGMGQTVRHHNGAIMVQVCPKCNGKVNHNSCNPCSSTGIMNSEVSVNVNIPGGVIDGNILRLGDMGNFVGSFGPIDQYTDAYLHVSVSSEPGLSIIDMDVVYKLELNLAEAVQGCKKTVKTIAGTQDIDIPPMSRNKDEIIISKMGVNGRGNQRNILDVQYPSNIGKLVNML